MSNGPVITCLDLETRPTEAYVWSLFGEQHIGLSQVKRPGGIILVAAQEIGKKVQSRAEWDEGGYEGALRWAWDVVDRCDYLVSYNGIGFDVKHLNAAWAEMGLAPPSSFRNIDLIQTVRKKFRWPSKKLEFVCKQLGVTHKTDPGGFQTWVDILDGEGAVQARAQKRMRKYAENDVKITVELFHRLLPWIDGMNIPLNDADDELAMVCNRCGSDHVTSRGFGYGPGGTRYRRYQCQDCMGWLRARKAEPVKPLLVTA